VTPGILDPVHVSDLTLMYYQGDGSGLGHHASRERASYDRHVFERLVIVRDHQTNIDPAILLGHNALVRDVLIDGSFDSCVYFGDRRSAYYYGPEPTTAWVSNLTCRLSGFDVEQPSVGFWVGNLIDGLMANVVVEGPAGLSLFGVPIDRDGAGDAQLPDRFTANAVSFRGFDPLFFQFADNPSYELLNVVDVPDSEPLLAADGRLSAGAGGIDAGVDPGTEPSLVRFAVELGTSVDGVSRAGRVVDQGAFEQGN
jgi:hypothetical protein